MGVWLAEPVFSHGQLNVAASRVGSRDKIKFAIKPVEEGWDNFTNNVVFREVLLDSTQLLGKPDSQQDIGDSVAAVLDPYSPSDMDYETIHDEVLPANDEEDQFIFKKPLPIIRKIPTKPRSTSQPKNLAPPELTEPRSRPLSSAAHEAWVSSLPDPPMEEFTEEEKEREAMLQRRAEYFKRMFTTL